MSRHYGRHDSTMARLHKGRSPRNRKDSAQAPEPVSKDLQSKLSHALDLPRSALPGTMQMELSGNREAIVDGCQGVLEYDGTVVKLSTGKMAVKFTGRGLQIKVLTHDSAIVEGFITGIEFIT